MLPRLRPRRIFIYPCFRRTLHVPQFQSEAVLKLAYNCTRHSSIGVWRSMSDDRVTSYAYDNVSYTPSTYCPGTPYPLCQAGLLVGSLGMVDM